MEDQEQPTEVMQPVSTGNGNATDTIKALRARRAELQPFGKKKVFEVAGYDGLLAIEYVYIGSEVTEELSKHLQRETRSVKGRGMTLLGSMDTLIAACSQVLIRDKPEDDWRPMDQDRPVRFDDRLADLLDFDADEPREVVLGLFGSEHSVIQQNIILSRWLADVTREGDEDFLGM